MTKGHKGRAGNTIPVAAEKLGMGTGQLRRAVDKGEVNYVVFAGLKRIPDAEIDRIAQLLGISVSKPAIVEPAQSKKARKAKPVHSTPREARA